MRDKTAFDKALEIGAGFDWITPLFSLFGQLRGKVEPFKVPEDWTPFVNYTLGEAGIKICNPMIVDNSLVFDIRCQDAERAAALLGLVRQ